MTKFYDLSDAQRMAYLVAIMAAGGEVAGYQEDGVQVSVPRDTGAFTAALEAAGLEEIDGTRHWFPLGSDAPIDRLRHDGRYPGSRGFWCFATFRPVS